MNEPKSFGYWSGVGEDPCLPEPKDYLDEDWSPDERSAVIRAIQNKAQVKHHWRGFSTCRICGKMNGSFCLTLGGWTFPEGLPHYMNEHGVRPPDEVVKDILNA